MYSSMTLTSGGSVHIWTPLPESGGQNPRTPTCRIAATDLHTLVTLTGVYAICE